MCIACGNEGNVNRVGKTTLNSQRPDSAPTRGSSQLWLQAPWAPNAILVDLLDAVLRLPSP
eukprot:3429528-Prorocentrum_lima.AAC.1